MYAEPTTATYSQARTALVVGSAGSEAVEEKKLSVALDHAKRPLPPRDHVARRASSKQR